MTMRVYYIVHDKEGVLQPACLATLKRIEIFVKQIIELEPEAKTLEGQESSRILHFLAGAFIETLQGSQVPPELREEVLARVQNIINSLPSDEDCPLRLIRDETRKLKSHLQHQIACSRCGQIGEISPIYEKSPNPNFKCSHCGYETRLLLRRELMDLNDPVEGELALRIAGESLL